jgi:hypothetical protein
MGGGHQRQGAGLKAHRVRPVNRTSLNRVLIEVIGDAVPDEEFDEFVDCRAGWRAILPSLEDRCAVGGFIPAVGERGFVKAMFALTGDWGNEEAAQKWF